MKHTVTKVCGLFLIVGLSCLTILTGIVVAFDGECIGVASPHGDCDQEFIVSINRSPQAVRVLINACDCCFEGPGPSTSAIGALNEKGELHHVKNRPQEIQIPDNTCLQGILVCPPGGSIRMKCNGTGDLGCAAKAEAIALK